MVLSIGCAKRGPTSDARAYRSIHLYRAPPSMAGRDGSARRGMHVAMLFGSERPSGLRACASRLLRTAIVKIMSGLARVLPGECTASVCTNPLSASDVGSWRSIAVSSHRTRSEAHAVAECGTMLRHLETLRTIASVRSLTADQDRCLAHSWSFPDNDLEECAC
jgi:hypothetical protein